MFRQEISPSSNFSLQISNFGNIGGSQNGWEFQDLALEFCISTKPAGNSLPRARVTAVFWSARCLPPQQTAVLRPGLRSPLISRGIQNGMVRYGTAGGRGARLRLGKSEGSLKYQWKNGTPQ